MVWVKKIISAKDWNNYYKHNNSYCFLNVVEKTEAGKPKTISIGFMVLSDKPNAVKDNNLKLVSDDEAILINEYRKSMNVYPLPLTKNFDSVK